MEPLATEPLVVLASASPIVGELLGEKRIVVCHSATGYGSGRSRLRTAVNSRARQGHGVGSLKSCKTMKEVLRRETDGTAVGGDRGADRPVAGCRGGREPARVAV